MESKEKLDVLLSEVGQPYLEQNQITDKEALLRAIINKIINFDGKPEDNKRSPVFIALIIVEVILLISIVYLIIQHQNNKMDASVLLPVLLMMFSAVLAMIQIHRSDSSSKYLINDQKKVIEAIQKATAEQIKELKESTRNQIENVATQALHLIEATNKNTQEQILVLRQTSRDEVNQLKTSTDEIIKENVDNTNRHIDAVNQQMVGIKSKMENLNTDVKELSGNIEHFADNIDRKTDAINISTVTMAKSIENQVDKIIENSKEETKPLKETVLKERLEKIKKQIEQKENELEYIKQERKQYETWRVFSTKKEREKQLQRCDEIIRKCNNELSSLHSEKNEIEKALNKLK
jgi:chromosome segregation ATPase